MKIRIQTTIELSEHDEAALRLYWEEVRDEGETFRDWYRSLFISVGEGFMDERVYDYGKFVRGEPQGTYGLDDRFAKDADGNTIVIAKVGDPKP